MGKSLLECANTQNFSPELRAIFIFPNSIISNKQPVLMPVDLQKVHSLFFIRRVFRNFTFPAFTLHVASKKQETGCCKTCFFEISFSFVSSGN